jgi:hypothetical protein
MRKRTRQARNQAKKDLEQLPSANNCNTSNCFTGRTIKPKDRKLRKKSNGKELLLCGNGKEKLYNKDMLKSIIKENEKNAFYKKHS